MKTNLKFDYNQLFISTEAFMADIDKKFRQLVTDIPVYMQISGDNNYQLNAKFQTVNKELYNKVPRVVFKLQNLELSKESNTQPNNVIEYVHDNVTMAATMKRNSGNLVFDCYFVTSNIQESFQAVVILMILFGRTNAYTYPFQGSSYQSAYEMTVDPTFEIPSVEDSKGLINVNFTISVQNQIFTPKLETIKGYKDEVMTNVDLYLSENIT